jgi:hypothetical protein
MDHTATVRCLNTGHTLATISQHDGDYLISPREPMVQARKSAPGNWYGVQVSSKPTTTGLALYDLKTEAKDNAQLAMNCRCGTTTVSAAALYDAMVLGLRGRALETVVISA